MAHVPTPCPCCGAYSLAPDADVVTLVAVSDVLVVKALERVGNFLIRKERARWQASRGTPTYLVHTLWQADDDIISRALRDAWEVVPLLVNAHGCCGVDGPGVQSVLDEYVHDLVLTGTPHDLHGPGGLEYRFESRLGLVLPEHRGAVDA